MLHGPNQEIPSLWASDLHELRIFSDDKQVVSVWRKDDTLVGLYNDIMVKHSLVGLTIVRPESGDLGLKLAAAIFAHPHVSGHCWFKTDDLYDTLGLKASQRACVWAQKKKDTFKKLADSFCLGDCAIFVIG